MRVENKMTLITFDPPIPQSGGGTRTFHLIKKILDENNVDLFILSKKSKLPLVIEKKANKIYFANAKNKKSNALLHKFLLLIAPWAFPKHIVILNAQYYILKTPNRSEKLHHRLINQLLKWHLYWYASLLYKYFNPAPARTYERYADYESIKNELSYSLKKSSIFWIEFTQTIYFFKHIKKLYPQLTVIVNSHNVEYIYHRRLAKNATNIWHKRWHNMQANAMMQLESQIGQIADKLLVCSKEDKKVFSNYMPDENIQVIPNGVDSEYFVPQENLSPYPSILFTGNMNYLPNQEAIRHFIHNIWPAVLAKTPHTIFIIAGRDAAELEKHYKDVNNLKFESSPEDMRPVYDKAWLVVVPLLSGSGTRLKILEAIAMQKRIISTSVGAEGLTELIGEQLIIEDDSTLYAKKISEFLTSRENFKCTTAIAEYGWNKITEKIKL